MLAREFKFGKTKSGNSSGHSIVLNHLRMHQKLSFYKNYFTAHIVLKKFPFFHKCFDFSLAVYLLALCIFRERERERERQRKVKVKICYRFSVLTFKDRSKG